MNWRDSGLLMAKLDIEMSNIGMSNYTYTKSILVLAKLYENHINYLLKDKRCD